jgi:hypothetical protein
MLYNAIVQPYILKDGLQKYQNRAAREFIYWGNIHTMLDAVTYLET